MTRFSSIEIATLESWDCKFLFKYTNQILEELYFWIKSVPCKNTKYIHSVNEFDMENVEGHRIDERWHLLRNDSEVV